MVIGDLLLKMGGVVYLSPTFNRGGEAAKFVVQVLDVTADGEVDIIIEHKNVEDTSWTNAGAFTTINAAGIYEVQVGTLLEQLRIKYDLTGSTDEWDGVRVLMYAPVWMPY